MYHESFFTSSIYQEKVNIEQIWDAQPKKCLHSVSLTCVGFCLAIVFVYSCRYNVGCFVSIQNALYIVQFLRRIYIKSLLIQPHVYAKNSLDLGNEMYFNNAIFILPKYVDTIVN